MNVVLDDGVPSGMDLMALSAVARHLPAIDLAALIEAARALLLVHRQQPHALTAQQIELQPAFSQAGIPGAGQSSAPVLRLVPRPAGQSGRRLIDRRLRRNGR